MSEPMPTRDELDQAYRELMGSHTRVVADDDCLVWTSQIEPEEVRWLWTGRIPMGTLTIFDGDPGMGKSILSTTLAAAVSTGRPMPGDTEIEAGTVLLVSLEDDPASATVPRLIAAGADRDKIAIIRIKGTEGLERLPALPDDIDLIHRLAVRQGAKLIVIDQLLAALSGEVNSDKSQDMSRVLAALVQVGRETGAAVLALRHLNKNIGLATIYRGLGSTGIIGTARSGMVVVDRPERPGELLLCVHKSNVGAKPKALAYRIEGAENGAGVIVWGEEVDITADRAMSGHGESEEDEPERSDAEQWLLELLKDGSVPAKQVFADGGLCGFSDRNLRTARGRLRIVTKKRGAPGKSSWFWSLPDIEISEGDAPEVTSSSSPSASSGDVAMSTEGKEKKSTLPPPQAGLPRAGENDREDDEDAEDDRLVEARVSSQDSAELPPPIPISAAPSYGSAAKEAPSDQQPATSSPEIDAHDVALLDFYKRAANEGIDIPAPKHAKQKRILTQYGFDRDLIDLESWPGPWCPHCTEEPVQREDDLCPRCETELHRTAERWRA